MSHYKRYLGYSLIFIKVNGPKPEEYKPDCYVQQWLSTGYHLSYPATGKKSEQRKRISNGWSFLELNRPYCAVVEFIDLKICYAMRSVVLKLKKTKPSIC